MVRDSTDPSGTVDALAGSGGSVFPVQSENAIRDEEGPGSFLSGVCFPALYGYGLTGPLGVLTIEEVGPLWEWSHRWLRPEGNYASLRVGDQVYGVLPVAFPDRLAGAGLPGLSGVEPVLPMLGRMLPRFAEVAESDGGLVGGGVADAVRTVRRGPVPGGVGWFRGRDWALNAAITSWEAAAGGDVVAAVVEAMEAWDSENRPTRDVLDGTARPRRRYGAAAVLGGCGSQSSAQGSTTPKARRLRTGPCSRRLRKSAARSSRHGSELMVKRDAWCSVEGGTFCPRACWCASIFAPSQWRDRS